MNESKNQYEKSYEELLNAEREYLWSKIEKAQAVAGLSLCTALIAVCVAAIALCEIMA